MKMNEAVSREFIGFEYREATVSLGMESVMTDGYMNFGWQLEGTSKPSGKIHQSILKLKRDRSGFNKIFLYLSDRFKRVSAFSPPFESTRFVHLPPNH